jgi:histidinol-phosphate aminotransferase
MGGGMSGILDLVREDLRDYPGYASARRAGVHGRVWLNANEAPVASPADAGRALHRYPEPQPRALRDRLAALYGVDPAQLLVTRGSDEGIDLLVRAFCRAGRDGVLVAPPCFGMYAACARIQGAPRVEVPLRDEGGRWRLDEASLLRAVDARAVRVAFLASPANPTGQALAPEAVERLARALAGRCLLVVVEAYVEFSRVPGATTLLARLPNLVVLRTLSKAHALAGARIGAVLADPGVIRVLANLMPPYPVPAPSAAIALAALEPDVLAATQARAARIAGARDELAQELARRPGVRRVYPSEGNFVLARFDDVQRVFAGLLAHGVVVREMRAFAGLDDALRISIGSPDDIASLLAALP